MATMPASSVLVLLLCGAAAVAGARVTDHAPQHPLEGKLPRQAPTTRPTVRASFPRESYSAGDRARLVIASNARGLRVQVFRAGAERIPIAVRDAMLGAAVERTRPVGDVRRGRIVVLEIRAWPSGLYFAKLTAAGGRIGYAPFVVRPRSFGGHRVAVVLPTQTWQAYNFSDDDRDGDEDTWYAGGATAMTGRPFENRGVPPNYRSYDQPFLRWLQETGRNVDYLAQSDLNELRSGRALVAAYDLIVFPGHHEYVTKEEYDAITTFRNRGGNLMFLSANNFFWKVTRRGDVMTRVSRWRQLGRPEAALIGVQYFANDRGTHRAPWVVRNAAGAERLLDSAGLENGEAFGLGGTEVDATTRDSPPGTTVLADLAWRRNQKAQMTYYRSAAGAKVFAAGSFFLVRSIRDPAVASLLQAVWTRLARP